MPSEPDILISVVSHRHGNLVAGLLDDLQAYCRGHYRVVVTMNVDEQLSFDESSYDFPLHFIYNQSPKGYAANQNAAFRSHKSHYFCVVNPDIRIETNPFPALMDCFRMPRVGVAAPRILNSKRETQISVRRFPTPVSILKKTMRISNSHDYAIDKEIISPDWVAGMFMLFASDVFEKLNGFDEKFFLYYEDVDICARLKLLGYKVAFCPSVCAVHDARWESHRNPQYFRWHLASIARYFFSKTFFKALMMHTLLNE